jgi:hypothetical protein
VTFVFNASQRIAGSAIRARITDGTWSHIVFTFFPNKSEFANTPANLSGNWLAPSPMQASIAKEIFACPILACMGLGASQLPERFAGVFANSDLLGKNVKTM